MLRPKEAENSVREALKMGYSLIDTANAYVNERACGRGVRANSIFASSHPHAPNAFNTSFDSRFKN